MERLLEIILYDSDMATEIENLTIHIRIIILWISKFYIMAGKQC